MFPHLPLQTELTLRLGLQLPFHVNYDRVHGLFFNGRLFEQPGANVTVIETRSAHECGSGPFFRQLIPLDDARPHVCCSPRSRTSISGSSATTSRIRPSAPASSFSRTAKSKRAAAKYRQMSPPCKPPAPQSSPFCMKIVPKSKPRPIQPGAARPVPLLQLPLQPRGAPRLPFAILKVHAPVSFTWRSRYARPSTSISRKLCSSARRDCQTAEGHDEWFLST